MTRTRRAYLATVGLATTGGCLDLAGVTLEDEPEPGTIHVGEETIAPEPDGSLPEPATDWPTYQFDRRNTGYNPAVETGAGPTPVVRWRRYVSDEEDFLRRSPSLHDGAVFVTTETDLMVLDAVTGATRWTVSLPAQGRTTPTVTADTVFVGTYSGLAAIDRSTREVAWFAPTTASTLSYDNPLVDDAPTVGDGMVFAGTVDGAMYGFDAASGERRWTTMVDALPDDTGTPAVGNTPSFEGPSVFADGSVYIGNWNGYLYAFDAETGERRWRNWSSPERVPLEPGLTLADDTLYAVSKGVLTALRAADGRHRWRFEDDPGSMSYAPVVTDDVVFVGSGPSFGKQSITAIDRADGSVRWRGGGRPQESFSADSGLLYVPLFGRLVALDRASGDVVWEMTTRSVISGPPAVTEGAVIVADERGTVYGIGRTDRR